MAIGLGIRRRVIYTIGLITMGLGMSLYTGQVNAEKATTPPNGTDWNASSDVRCVQNLVTNLWFKYLSSDTDPFCTPKRGTLIDFTRTKTFRDPVRVSRTSDGALIAGEQRFDDPFMELEFADGDNLSRLIALRRWQALATDPDSFWNGSSIYVGYQHSGPALQLTTAARMPLGESLSLRLDYRMSAPGLETMLARSGFLSTDALRHQVKLGLVYNF